ncbi:MAG: hypothetical protein II547_10320, partial [Treponema sp.]|nr:hypothetical protein [Treponema sp.]
FKIRFKVGDTGDSDGVFKETHTIRFKEIKDKDPLSGEINLDLQFDNMAPVIATDEDTGYNIIKYEAPEKNRVVNYNGFYTFGSWAKEEPVHGVNQTGVSRVAVYFTRNVGNDAHDGIFDPMIAKDATGNRSPVTDLAYEDNLYWRTVGISTGQAANHTLVLAGSDPNIHAGGLIKVNGIIYRIDRVDGSTLTLDTSFAGHGTAGTAKIAIANVVDNPLQEGDGTGEKNAAGYWTNPALDDGDCMIESFIKQGSKCTWDANINTRNIGDGTAYLHYVVFDEAGNSSHESVPIYIGNNLPRVAGLKFATDNSTNGDYEGDEICDDYSGLYAGGKDGRNDVTKIVFPSESTDAAPVAIATVKNKMLLQPEIVGGNGNLKYVASIAKRNGSTGWNAPYKTLAETALKNSLGSQLVGSTDDTAKEGKVEFTVPYMITNEFRDGDNQKLKLLVKDSTPGESMEAEVSVILNLALRDSNPPVIKIRPFYWNSSAENSLFGNSTKNGHIELPSDLPESFVSDGSGVDDRQPKVSGKIKIEGIAQDDAQLRVIKLDVFGTEKTVGTYNGAWEIGEELTSGGEIPASGYAFTVEQAKYADLIREGIITAVPEGKEEDDKVNYFSAEYGHVVKWTAYIDTAKVMTDAAETDREIKAYAVDRGTPNATGSDYENPNHSEDNDVSAFKEDGDNEGAQSGGTNGSGVHTDFYAVDVVPYITDVTTALSLTKKNNPSVYSRSALGHYPVAATETVKMTGFNLAGGTVKFNAETGTADVAYNASGFAIPSGAKSGNVSISVNGVGSLNNKNGNDSHGSYAKTVDLSANPTGDKTIYDNYYNRQPNGDNNNLLTDDVVLDIWQFKDAGISQTSGYITEPIMKVNPKNGMLNFGFNSGPANYCMANGENTSYTTWVGNYARFSTCGFTVDENGRTHGISVGLDTNPGSSGSSGRLEYFYSGWGRSE